MKKVILLAITVFSLISIQAQNETQKWAVGAGISAIDFSGPITKQYFQLREYRGNQRLFVGRYLNPSFNLKMDFTFGKVWFPRVDNYPGIVDGIYDNEHIYDLGLNIEYKFNNGYILKEKAIVAPYLFTGLGTNFIIGYGAKEEGATDINTFIPFGVGLNIRATNWLTFNLQSAYKLNIDNSFDYTHHNASVVFNFGAKPKGTEVTEIKNETLDSDKDGISDLEDECPFAAGTVEFFGCPDTDGDGLGDSRDECPKMAGAIINKGCPTKDTDGDGVSDEKDSCPNVKGEMRYAGCPDTDGDGIVDKYDKCPNTKGIASNSGCPGTNPNEHLNHNHDHGKHDNNQINHHTNTTTNHTIQNNQTVNSTMSNTGNVVEKVTIYFGSASDVVPTSERNKLTKIISALNSNSGYRALIKGYTDKQGDSSSNVDLSLKRATTVWMYLSNNGMSGDRADLFGYGESETTSTDQGSRRVVVEIVK